MAAPHASGVAALLASTHPSASPKELTQLLDSEADPVACPGDYDLNGTGAQDAYCTGDSTYNSFYGHGLVDALAAVSSGSVDSDVQRAPAAPPVQAVPATTASPTTSVQPPVTSTVAPATTEPSPPSTTETPVLPSTTELTPVGGPAGGFALLGVW
jgi:subtilisin family serine protease